MAPSPDVGNPDATFSSLLTLGGDSKDDEREDPNIVDDREDIDGEELGGCNDPVEAAAAAAAKNETYTSYKRLVQYKTKTPCYYCHTRYI